MPAWKHKIRDTRVSILIPVHNAENTLAATLDSALAQSSPDTEIVVLDDGSTDDSWGVIQTYAKHVRAERQENLGGCAARNRLLDMTDAPFIQYLDADDIIDPEKITEQLAYLEGHRETGVVTDTMRLFYEEPNEDGVLFTPHSADWWVSLINVRIPFTSSALWRREAIEVVGRWNEVLPSGQEYDLYFRMLKQDIGIAHLDLAKTRYRMPSRNGPPKRDPVRTIEHRVCFLDQIEEHLIVRNVLTAERGVALVSQRLQLARKLWQWDRLRAMELSRAIRRVDIARLRPDKTLPRSYLACATALGFRMTEALADMARKHHGSSRGV